MNRALRRVLIEVSGWTLVVAGLAALVLPGPGLLLLAAGLVVLSQQYEWAERRLEPVKREALKGAATSVQSRSRIALTMAGIVVLAVFAAVWLAGPDSPGWWPVDERWWLPGGQVTGITMSLSAAVAVGLLVWSYRTYHDNPEALAAVVRSADADDERTGFLGR